MTHVWKSLLGFTGPTIFWIAGVSLGHACGDWEVMSKTDPVRLPYTNEPAAYNDATRAASTRACAMLLSEFKPHLSSAHQRMLSEINVQITSNLRADKVGARQDGSRKLIEISIGFIGLFSTLSDMFLFYDLPNATERSGEYIDYVTKIAVSNSKNQDRAVAKSFPRFLGLTQAQERELYEEEQVYKKRSALYVESLALVLAHELAHHFLGHLPPSPNATEQQQREREADAFAVDLVIKSGHQPFLGILPYFFFIQIQGDPIHAAPECRFLAVLEPSIAALVDAQNSSAVPGVDMKAWARQMQAKLPPLRQHCAEVANLRTPKVSSHSSAFERCMAEMPAKCLDTCLRKGIPTDICHNKACLPHSEMNVTTWTRACRR